MSIEDIAADLTKCFSRIAEIQSGKRGVIPESFRHSDAGRAFDNRLRTLQVQRDQLEREYVIACIAESKWQAAEVIRRMSLNL